ncbi:MAG: hypothetical protein WAU45_13440 [Blastocatellia bacterium]
MTYGMRSKSIWILGLVVLMLVSPADLFAQKKEGPKGPPKQFTPAELAEMSRGKRRPPTGASFYLAPIAGAKNQYSLLLTDADNRTVAGTFRLSQISIFQALVIAAKEFAETNESVGTTAKPVTTRFRDKDELSFVIDVQKTATHSRFFVSMNCVSGKITVDAGAIKRGSKEEGDALFLKILPRVEVVLAGSQ